MATKINTIDDYINTFPEDTQGVLEKIRQTIRKAAPKAEEAITYDMPTFKLKGKNLVHFSVWKNHIGMYPQPAGTGNFQKELSPYKAGTSTVQFPLDRPIPYDLVQKMVSFLVKERPKEEQYRLNEERSLTKKQTRARAVPKPEIKAKPKTTAKPKAATKTRAAVRPKAIAKSKVKPKNITKPKPATKQIKAKPKKLKTRGTQWKQTNKKSRQTYGSTSKLKKRRSSTQPSSKTQKSAGKRVPAKRALKSTASRKAR